MNLGVGIQEGGGGTWRVENLAGGELGGWRTWWVYILGPHLMNEALKEIGGWRLKPTLLVKNWHPPTLLELLFTHHPGQWHCFQRTFLGCRTPAANRM